jgi:hypothetical protein
VGCKAGMTSEPYRMHLPSATVFNLSTRASTSKCRARLGGTSPTYVEPGNFPERISAWGRSHSVPPVESNHVIVREHVFSVRIPHKQGS